jgi:hypothetical protein
MGNQPSKDGLIDNTNQKRIRSNSSHHKQQQAQSYQQLEKNRINHTTIPTKSSSSSSRLLSSRQQGCSNGPVVVSPVRHQLVLTDHVTPLVSLSAASSFGVYQRRSSNTTPRDTRSMSSTSIASDEEPNTPTYLHRSSYDEFANSFMYDIQQQQQKKLSSSLPIKHSDAFIINSTSMENGGRLSSYSNRKRDSSELWVYEYGAEKERDR